MGNTVIANNIHFDCIMFYWIVGWCFTAYQPL